jgi:hypothetical protein
MGASAGMDETSSAARVSPANLAQWWSFWGSSYRKSRSRRGSGGTGLLIALEDMALQTRHAAGGSGDYQPRTDPPAECAGPSKAASSAE